MNKIIIVLILVIILILLINGKKIQISDNKNNKNQSSEKLVNYLQKDKPCSGAYILTHDYGDKQYPIEVMWRNGGPNYDRISKDEELDLILNKNVNPCDLYNLSTGDHLRPRF